jgi:O-antigen ligase
MNLCALIALTGVLVLLAVAGAGAYPWAICIAAVTLACAALICSRTSRTSRLFELGVLAVMLYLLVTILPMPVSWTRLAGSERYGQNTQAAEAIQRAHDVGLLPTHAKHLYSLTRNRAGSMRIAVLFAAAASCITLVGSLSPACRRLALHLLLLLAAGIAAAGCISLLRVPQGDTLWWAWPIRHGLPGPVACFVNRNHFAGFSALLTPVAATLFFDNINRRQLGRAALCLATWVILSIAVLAAMSRGAILAWGAGMLILPVILLILRRHMAVLALLLAACIGTSLLTLSSPVRDYVSTRTPVPLKARLATLRNPNRILSLQSRLEAWRDGLRVIHTYPLLGAGPEGFRMVYPQHRKNSERAYLTHAENEYVQLIAEGGLFGMLAALMFVAGCLAPIVQRDKDAYLAAAAVTGMTVALVHALSDFPLRVPLYAISLAALVGCLMPPAPSESIRDTRRHGSSWPALCALLLALLLAPFWRSMRIRDAHPFIRNAGMSDLARCLAWAPTSWYTWMRFGQECYVPASQATVRLGHHATSMAVHYDPNNYVLWARVGHYRLKTGDRAGARVAFDRVKALRDWVHVPDIPEGD